MFGILANTLHSLFVLYLIGNIRYNVVSWYLLVLLSKSLSLSSLCVLGIGSLIMIPSVLPGWAYI